MIKKLLFLLLVLSFNSYSQNNFLDMDGIDDNVDVANSANILANATSISMSCKVYPKRITSGFPDFNGFAGYRNESNFDFYLIQLTTTDVEARFRNSTGVAYTITYTGLVLNQWNHFFLIYNSATSTLKLYSGNTEVGSIFASGAAPASSTGNMKIGFIPYQAFSWYHSGYIDEISLWNKALLPTDIANIMANAGEIASPASETNLKLYYKCNQGIPYGNNLGLTTLNDELALHNGTLANFGLNGQFSNWGSQLLGNPQFNENNVTVYPNPVSDFIFVSGLSDDVNVKIFDTTGRMISQQSLELGKIDVSQLNSGLYFLVVNDTQKIKFIKK